MLKITQVKTKRMVIWGAVGTLLVLGLVYSFWPRPIAVDLARVERGELRVSVEEEGKTRVRDVYILSAPVSGRLRRIKVNVGDPTTFGETLIAEIEPADSQFLDPRSEVQAEAEIQSAQAAMELARADVNRVQAELDFARAELTRAKGLIKDKTISQRELDEAERAFKTQRAALAQAQAALQVRSYELERARALLLSPAQAQQSHGNCECIRLSAPVGGRVLHLYRESEAVVASGEALVSIGDPSDLEIIVELHSSQAVKVKAGQEVIIENWGGDESLQGRVRRVEPVGFTKISALGIEEQRVNVIIDFTSPHEQWQRLGHAYQLDVRILLWKNADVLKLPLIALFRDTTDDDSYTGNWAVFVNDSGRARKRRVELGHRNDLEAEVLSGVQEGDLVVLHPSDQVVDGVSIVNRKGSESGGADVF
ncbi:MAG: HlyD family efflux transporter periplasmic adaptor subunit [Exilibacterium sp.]